jgi:glycyl-tRNA synthetase beta chain
MTTQSLLVELFVEELPPKALQKLGNAFSEVLSEQLRAQGLLSANSVVTSYATPRRLAAHISAVIAQAPDRQVEQKLMPVAVGFDASGNATPALLKKLQALGAGADALTQLRKSPESGKDALVLFYDSQVKGATLAVGLQKALDEAIAKLPIPKVMTYQLEKDCELPGWSSVQFVRPAHGLVALYGSTIVAVTALGLQAGNSTGGHRFEAKVTPVVFKSADTYAEQLKSEGAVIASFTERRDDITRQLAAVAAKIGGGVRAIEDAALLDEVTALVERPNVLSCTFEKEFLDVPPECLILTMKANQKYFPLLDAQGKLSNQFLVVSNITPDDASAVIGGNERVVRPRLADAKFFIDQDRKKSLAIRAEGLANVVYHNKLGTQAERTQRVRAIAKAIAGLMHKGDDATFLHAVETAAQLAKADLLTDMVGEFPELQGIMGGYYARHDGLHADIAEAVGLDLQDATESVSAGQHIDAAISSRRPRNPAFRQEVLRAYEYRCCVCGFDLRVGHMPAGLEAAHIQWHNIGGPDEVSNGLALCSLHHKLFDLGAFTIEPAGYRVVFSQQAISGSRGLSGELQHHGSSIHPPQRSDLLPAREYLHWNAHGPFKTPARPLAALAAPHFEAGRVLPRPLQT